MLDEEACRSRTFQPGGVGWTLSSLNQNQAVAYAQKSKEKETSRLRWPDKNGEQKIVLHSAYLAAIYSKEDSPREVFHHDGVWQPGPPSSYSLRTSSIGRRHICWRPSISHRVCTHHFQGRVRSWENPSRIFSRFGLTGSTGKCLEWQPCGLWTASLPSFIIVWLTAPDRGSQQSPGKCSHFWLMYTGIKLISLTTSQGCWGEAKLSWLYTFQSGHC